MGYLVGSSKVSKDKNLDGSPDVISLEWEYINTFGSSDGLKIGIYKGTGVVYLFESSKGSKYGNHDSSLYIISMR